MTYYCYGQTRSQSNSSPTAFDPVIGYTVFTAGENPVEIVAGSVYGGQNEKVYQVGIVPPAFVTGSFVTGNTGYHALTQFVNVNTATYGIESFPVEALRAERLFSNNSKWIIPPFHQIIVLSAEVTSGAITFNFLGMDLIKP